ncbi:MAG: hypothetical protein ABUR63_04320, partial [Verrucomicrobiota bacterium]
TGKGGGGGGHGGGAGRGGSGGAGAGGASGGQGGGGDFSAVLAIFADHCVTCHDATKVGLPTYPQLSLTAADAHDALVGHPADETCGGIRVVAGDPASSYLIKKLTEATPCSGVRMPRPFEILPVAPLSADQIATISRWISAGAPR